MTCRCRPVERAATFPRRLLTAALASDLKVVPVHEHVEDPIDSHFQFELLSSLVEILLQIAANTLSAVFPLKNLIPN